MSGSAPQRRLGGPLAAELSRRDFVRRAGSMGLGAVVLSALPAARHLAQAEPAAADVPLDEATLQAFFDTIIPGRPAGRTDLGDEIHPSAIAGVDADPGAVEADALRLSRDPLVGFVTLAPPFLVDLNARSLPHGGPFLLLPFDARVQAALSGLAFDNPSRPVYEAAAAVAFTAFCGAAVHPIATSANASGYRVMGYPGAAPNGYAAFSYRRRLARGRTRAGNLP